MIAKGFLFGCLFIVCVAGFSCPPGWTVFQNSCYLFVDENVPWTAAEVICRTMDGRIVEVESMAENDFLVQQMSARTGIENVWLGLTDFIKEGTWQWMSTKETPEFTNWGAGEPDNAVNAEGGQDCVYILRSGVWDDESCFHNVVRHAVGCEREASEEEIVG